MLSSSEHEFCESQKIFKKFKGVAKVTLKSKEYKTSLSALTKSKMVKAFSDKWTSFLRDIGYTSSYLEAKVKQAAP